MQHIVTPSGVPLSYDTFGSGPPLVLVHGSFSNHQTNWEFVRPLLGAHFTTYAVARRGRGETGATRGHSVEDESEDICALLETIGEPAFLLGHSYGGQIALAAALRATGRVRRLVLYEPPWPTTLSTDELGHLERLAERGAWDDFARRFFHQTLEVPAEELDDLCATDIWPAIMADAEATLGDLLALSRYDFDVERVRGLCIPVLLQIGSESRRDLYITDALATVIPRARIEPLPGQSHEAMTTAPEQYAASVVRFLLE